MSDNKTRNFVVLSVIMLVVIAATMMPFSWTLGTADGSAPTEFDQKPMLNGVYPDHTEVDVLNSSLGVRVQTQTTGRSRVTVTEDQRPFLQNPTLNAAAQSRLVRVQSPTPLDGGTISFQLSSTSFDSNSTSVYWHEVGTSSLVRQNTRIDRKNNSITAPVTGSGTYVVLSDQVWSERNSREMVQGVTPVELADFQTASSAQRDVFLPHLQNRTVEGTVTLRLPSEDSSAKISLQSPSNDTVTLAEFYGNPLFENETQQDSFSTAISGSTGGQATVSLETTNGASITVDELTVIADSDGDGLTDRAERSGLATEFGPIYTDPFDADTDGDGVADSVEIRPLRNTRDSRTHHLVSDPTHLDSDGDGITDHQELNGRSEVIRTITIWGTDEAKFYRRHSGEAEFDSYWSDGSDPLEPDTDNDGVDDLNERRLQTDPTNADTDKDHIPDGEELVRETDPSLHDDEPPRIEVIQKTSRLSLSSLATEHRIVYFVGDAAGVNRTSIQTSEKVYDQQNLQGIDSRVVTTTYKTQLFTDVGAEVQAVDENGNEIQTVDLVRPAHTESWYQNMLEQGAPSVSETYYNGFLRGVRGFVSEEFWSIINAPGNFIDFVKRLAEDPIAVIGAGVDTIRILTDRGVIDTLLEGFEANIEQKQASVNPYEIGSREYSTFENGYKAGFAIPLLLLLAVPAGQSKAVGRGSKLVSKADDFSGALRSLRSAADIPDRLMSSAKNAGSRHRIWHAQRELSPKTLNEFRGAKESELRRYLEQGGPKSARALESQPGIRSVLANNDIYIDPQTRVDASLSLARAADAPRISRSNINTIASRIEAQEADRALMYRLLASDSPNHDVVRFMAESDESDLSAFLALSREKGVPESDLARYAREAGPRGDTVPFDGLESNLDSIDQIEHSGRTTVVSGTVSDTSVTMRYPDDGNAYLTNQFDLRGSSFRTRGQRAALAEDTIAPRIAQSKGYEILSMGNKQVTTEGIDLIARSPDGDIVIIEVKSNVRGKSVGASDFASTRTGPNGEMYDQMTDPWIKSAFRGTKPSDVRSYDEVEAAVRSGSYRREAIIVQNSRNGRSVRSSVGSRVDNVEIIKLGDSDRISSLNQPQTRQPIQTAAPGQATSRIGSVV